MKLDIKVGSDPELFLLNPNSGKFVSAEGIVPGDKLNPHKVKKGTISVDGFAAEIGIDPASSADEFVENHLTVLEELKKYTGGYEFALIDHTVFDEDVYTGQSEKGRELGCDPDFNAYTRLANPTPTPNPRSLRTAAGHLHVSWDQSAELDITDHGHFMDCVAVAKQLDWFVGVPSTCWGKGSVRRSLYGKAGAFRVKPYGMEYRTPDNGWLKSEARMRLMFNNVQLGMAQLYAGKHVYNQFEAAPYINGSTVTFRKYLDALGIPYLDDVVKAEPKKAPPKKNKTLEEHMVEVLNNKIAGRNVGQVLPERNVA